MNILAQTLLWATCIALTFHPLGFLVNLGIAITWAIVDTVIEVASAHQHEKKKYLTEKSAQNPSKKMTDGPASTPDHLPTTHYKKIAKTAAKSLAKNIVVNAAYLILPPVIKGIFRVALSKLTALITSATKAPIKQFIPCHQARYFPSTSRLFRPQENKQQTIKRVAFYNPSTSERRLATQRI